MNIRLIFLCLAVLFFGTIACTLVAGFVATVFLVIVDILGWIFDKIYGEEDTKE